MKKFLCMLMALLMLALPALTACSGSEEAGEGEDGADVEVVRAPMTLSLWLPTSADTSDESIKMVEDALSALTIAKFDTAIELHLIPEDEYENVIANKITSIDEVKEAAASASASREQQIVQDAIDGVISTGDVAEEPVDEENEVAATVGTQIDENGQSVSVYPAVEDDQLDIFLVKDYAQYQEYIKEELIISLDAAMSAVGQKLHSYIYPAFLKAAKTSGLYGIPSNHVIGNYQLLLVNKEIADTWNYDPAELTDFYTGSVEDFILDIGQLKANGAEGLENVTPLLGKVEAPNMVFFSVTGDDTFSVICNQLKPGIDKVLTVDALKPKAPYFTSFEDNLFLMKKFEELGYIGDGVIDDGEEFAVAVVDGEYADIAKYSEDYYVSIHEYPEVAYEDVFESVFCVSKYTKDDTGTRAMEIITYLNTDSTVKTLLQYGIENYHWRKSVLNGEDVIDVIRDDYKMNTVDTGNVYLTYPAENVPMSFWENGKKQNLDTIYNPYLGFEYVTEDNQLNFNAIASTSVKYLEDLEALTVDEFETGVKVLNQNLSKLKLISEMLSEEGGTIVSDSILMQLATFLQG